MLLIMYSGTNSACRPPSLAFADEALFNQDFNLLLSLNKFSPL